MALESPGNPKRRALERAIRRHIEPYGYRVAFTTTQLNNGSLVVVGRARYADGACLLKGDVWFQRPRTRKEFKELQERRQLRSVRERIVHYARPADCGDHLNRILLRRVREAWDRKAMRRHSEEAF